MAPLTEPAGRSGLAATRPSGAGDTAGPLVAWCGLALVLLARVYRAMLLTLVIAAMLPTLWDWSSYVVRSGSMEPVISVGDVVITQPFNTTSPVPVGRVMLFTPPDAVAPRENRLHRVVENLGAGSYITAGDANRNDDATPVPAANFNGRAIICVPFIGLPLVWLSTGNLALLMSWVLGTMLALYFSSRPSCHAKHRRRGHGSDATDGEPPAEDPATASAGLAAIRMILRPGYAAVAMAVVIGTTAATQVGVADAAFSDTTVNAANTWKVAVNTSRATSKLQIYDSPGPSSWYQRSNVAVNISATASSGTTVRSITYRVNGGTRVTVKSSSLVFTLNTQGDNMITYFATDGFGSAETTHTAHIKLDDRAPAVAVTSRTGDMTHAQWRAACTGTGTIGGVCGTLIDPTPGSGAASVDYVVFRSSDSRCFNGTAWTAAACQARTPAALAAGRWSANVPDSVLAVPRTWYTIAIYAQDIAGNTINTTRNFSVG